MNMRAAPGDMTADFQDDGVQQPCKSRYDSWCAEQDTKMIRPGSASALQTDPSLLRSPLCVTSEGPRAVVAIAAARSLDFSPTDTEADMRGARACATTAWERKLTAK